MLIALEIVLSRFCSIATPIMKIGFGFVPIAMCGMLFGPVWAGFAGGIADIIGAILFPIGAFFPGFTVSAILTGVVFGLFLFNRKESWEYLGCAVSINCIVISLGLSTYWLTIITGSPFIALLPARVLQNIIIIPVQLIVLRLIQKLLIFYSKKQYV
jgi:ECF transporter S component (folate family)